MKETPEQLTKRRLDLEDSTNKRIDQLDRMVANQQALLYLTWAIILICFYATR